MNVLPRLERRAKDADIDLIASADILGVLSPADCAMLEATDLERTPGDTAVPETSSIRFRRMAAPVCLIGAVICTSGDAPITPWQAN